MMTFHGFQCIAGNSVILIHRDDGGLYFHCSEGKHYLERQIDIEGNCLGLTAML